MTSCGESNIFWLIFWSIYHRYGVNKSEVCYILPFCGLLAVVVFLNSFASNFKMIYFTLATQRRGKIPNLLIKTHTDFQRFSDRLLVVNPHWKEARRPLGPTPSLTSHRGGTPFSTYFVSRLGSFFSFSWGCTHKLMEMDSAALNSDGRWSTVA